MPAERIPIPELKKKLDAKKNLVVVDVARTERDQQVRRHPRRNPIPMAQIEKRAGEVAQESRDRLLLRRRRARVARC